MYTFDGFGYLPAVTIVGTAAANVSANAYHAVKVSSAQQKFQAQLETDEQQKEYIKFIILRLQSMAERLGKNGKYRPGTAAFEEALKLATMGDMNYRSNCNADIYQPMKSGDVTGKPREIWASIDRTGYIKPGGVVVPPDIGPIWATGCKNAEDQARMAYIDRFKGEKKFEFLKLHKEDIGTLDVLLRAGTGILLVALMFLVIRIQRAVIKEQ